MISKNLRALWTETAPDKALARARRLVEKGRLDSAAETLKSAIEAEGDDPILRIELSQILVTAGMVREAADGLRAFLKAHPSEYRRVCDFVDWARAHHHESQPLHEILGEHHVSRREFTAALEALEKVDKQGLQALLEARLSNLQRFLEKASGSVPKSAIPLLYFAALIQEALLDFPKAIDTYRRILTASPTEVKPVEERLKGIIARNYKSATLRSALAEIYLGAGEEARALEEYVQMVEVDARTAPQVSAALEAIAEKAGNAAPALWALVRVRRREKKTEEFLKSAGSLIALGEHLEDLRALLEGAIADGEDDPRLNLLIGEASLRAGKVPRATTAFMTAALHASTEIQAKAREGLERVLEAHPGETRVLQALADQHLRDGRIDACVDVLERLARCDEASKGVAASRLQTVLLARPGHPGAEKLLESLAPASGNPLLAAAFLRRRIRQGKEEAARVCEEVMPLVQADPRDPELRLALAEALAASGEMAAAWSSARPLVDGTMGPDPTLLHLLVLIGGTSIDLCRAISETFRTMAPALAGAPEGQFALGEMAARCGDTPSALEAFRTAASFSPAAAAEVIAAVRSMGSGGMLGEAAVSLGEALLDAGDFAGAASILSSAGELPPSASKLIARLEEGLRTSPESVDLRVALASVLTSIGRASRGREVIEDGLRRAGEAAHPSLHFAQGDTWLADGNLTESIRAYSRAMARDKTIAAEAARRIERVLTTDVGHPAAHLALGRALLLDGRPREGVNELLTAWSIRPSLGASILKDLAYAARSFPLEPQVDLARSQVLLGQGEVEAASDALGAALRTAPSIATEVLARLGGVTKSHPSCARAHFHAAHAWLTRRRCREASESFVAAAENEAGLIEPAAAGLASVMRAFPERPEPHVARARLYESQENWTSAAESYRAAAARGAEPSHLLQALKKIAALEGPQRGRVLLALGASACDLDSPVESAEAFEQAAAVAPEILAAVREEVESLESRHPSCGEAILVAARIAFLAQEPEAALRKAERLQAAVPSRWRDAVAIADEALLAGASEVECQWLAARALSAAGEYQGARERIERVLPRAEGATRIGMCLLVARVAKRQGDREASKRWLAEAEAMAGDREAFLRNLHDDALSAARSALDRRSSVSEKWRALRASLDLGDADRAEGIAGDLGLARATGGDRGAGEMAAAEVFARIACLRDRFAEAAELLSPEPASALKAYALRRAGRISEAAACLIEISPRGAEPSLTARSVYLELAAGEFLGAAGSLMAATSLRFPTGPEGVER